MLRAEPCVAWCARRARCRRARLFPGKSAELSAAPAPAGLSPTPLSLGGEFCIALREVLLNRAVAVGVSTAYEKASKNFLQLLGLGMNG